MAAHMRSFGSRFMVLSRRVRKAATGQPLKMREIGRKAAVIEAAGKQGEGGGRGVAEASRLLLDEGTSHVANSRKPINMSSQFVSG